MIADLHIHSKYARGCSNKLTVENIWKKAAIKGIDIIGTGDFTHPQWLEELKNFLEIDDSGFLIPKKNFLNKWIEDLKSSNKDEFPFQANDEIINNLEQGFYPKFVLQTEINNVFSRQVGKKEKKHRIHNCIIVKDFEIAEKVLNYLSQFGKVESDGRLAVRQDQQDTLFWLKSNFPDSIFFPAHIWTPYFGVLGSKYGFSSLKEAFGKSYFLIDAVETGLSSDPIMNWINREIDPFVIISNSDAHSLENMAREGNIIKSIDDKHKFTYKDLEKILKYRKYKYFKEQLLDFEKEYLDNLFSTLSNFYLDSTIEFYPQEGKYFGDGHSKCEFSTSPSETIKRNGLCPICGKPLTIGVFHRTFDLGDSERKQKIDFGSKYFWTNEEINKIAKIFDRPVYRYIVPLWDIIKEVWGYNKGTKSAQRKYNELILKFGPEFYILLDLPIEKAYEYDKKFGEALEKVRKGDIVIKSGYDGVYGIVKIWEKEESNKEVNNYNYTQLGLFT